MAEDQYEVTIIIPPEEGFMGVGAVDAVVEVALIGEEIDYESGEFERMPPELLISDYEDDEDEDRWDDDAEVERDAAQDGRAGESDRPEALRLREFLERVLYELGLKAKVRVTEGPEELSAEITGDDLGILIGRRGQTLDAIEYLASIAVFAGSHQRKRVELDAEGYKERRRRQVERVAMKKADEAAKRGRAVQLAPMTPAERKIVHLALRSRTDVTTVSQGREPNRSVIISPVHDSGRR